jgi:rare lipoprotein A
MKRLRRIGLTLTLLTVGSVINLRVHAETVVEQGEASYYADSLQGSKAARQQGSKTASGEPCGAEALTAAHRTLPFGSKATVTYLKTGRSVEVTINDRGPYAKDRLIDISRAAA